MRRPALLLLLLCFLTFFLGLGRAAVTDADEAYYAESAREMVERGDWLTPFYNYEHRWQKPVLYYWVTAATYHVFGVSEWSARVWSALAGAGLVFVTWWAAVLHTRRDDVGWLAGAIVATSFGYCAIARMALPDLPLAFFITVTIAAAFADRWGVAGVAAGFGFLVKGPLALLIPAFVFVPVWWRERRARQVHAAALARAALLFTLVGLPWYVAMTVEHGTTYLDSFFVGDNLERFATGRFNEPRSPFFYAPVLLGGLLPWTAYLVAAVVRPVRNAAARRLRMSDEEWRLLIWAVMPLLFFSVSIGKQPRYILPVLPPVAVLLARAILDRIDAAARGHRAAQRELRIATYATAALLVVVAIVLARARELFVTAYPALTWVATGALIGCAIALVVVGRRREFSGLTAILPVCAAITLLAVQYGAMSGRRPEPVEEMAALVRANRHAGEPIGAHHVFVRNLIFYTGLPQADLHSDERATAFMRSPQRVLMVIREDDLARLETAAGVMMTRLGEVRYFNTANVKARSLLFPGSAREVPRVLLVANR